jgi:hypothetical protein
MLGSLSPHPAAIGCGGTGSDELFMPILAVPPVRSSPNPYFNQ